LNIQLSIKISILNFGIKKYQYKNCKKLNYNFNIVIYRLIINLTNLTILNVLKAGWASLVYAAGLICGKYLPWRDPEIVRSKARC